MSVRPVMLAAIIARNRPRNRAKISAAADIPNVNKRCARKNGRPQTTHDNKKTGPGRAPFSLTSFELAVTLARREAISAIDRLISARLERKFRHTAAGAARRGEHFAVSAAKAAARSAAFLTAAACLTGRTAITATARLIGKAFARKKLLFARGERERRSAVNAIQVFILVHKRVS
jgi:hypothetical protein